MKRTYDCCELCCDTGTGAKAGTMGASAGEGSCTDGAADAFGAYLRDAAAAFRRIGFFAADARAIGADPAIRAKFLGFAEVILYASFWALALHRIAHFLSALGIPFVPRLISQVARLLTGIEIHPGARLGPGLFIDHGMGVVIGETAIVGANVLIYHGVTLGGVDSRPCRRHPLVGNDVVIGAGAKVLGPVTIGDGARIGAASVVLRDVPAGATAVGVPARIL
jgi:serine O-acetyltransferase